GLSPKENRDVPPLDYALVTAMKARFPDLWIGINGGITTLDQAKALLAEGLDEVMIGRAAYQTPADILLEADPQLFGTPAPFGSRADVVRAMLPTIEAHLRTGGRLNQITRHMLGLFAGQPGARRWRQILSQEAHLLSAGAHTVERALAAVD
ncbi:MAG: tRNA-dihydrouridine synthase, partial [Devosiaceae bacterium]|nr:tRNA-dihydrouridine synthase [Devosiaceae bacterium MH13]